MKIDNWFTGIIEDCDEDNKRVRVRMFGLHSFELDSSGSPEILTTDLPWSTLLLPVTSEPSYSNSISGLLGSWAFGFFRDGDDMQDAVVIGIYKGPQNAEAIGGFNPLFNSTGYTDSMPFANSYSSQINVGANVVPASAVGGYRPITASHSDNGLLKTFKQKLPTISYDETIASRILQPALSQLNKNISYNGNSGPIAEYFRATDYPIGASKSAHWCAAFVCWVIKQSGLFDESSRPKTASANGFLEWSRNEKDKRTEIIYNPSDMRSGDIIKFSHSHVGIVVEASNGNTFKSIEGNTTGATIRINTQPLTRASYAIRIIK
jgi:hypothetical protein